MPDQSANSPLGAFFKALKEEKIPCILIGMMAAIRQGAPLTTIDYDLWVKLPERQYVRLGATRIWLRCQCWKERCAFQRGLKAAASPSELWTTC